jgi:hypothetical protein
MPNNNPKNGSKKVNLTGVILYFRIILMSTNIPSKKNPVINNSTMPTLARLLLAFNLLHAHFKNNQMFS